MTSGNPGVARPSLAPRARWLLPLLIVLLAAVTLHRYSRPPERRFLELEGSAMGTTWSVKLAVSALPAEQERAVEDAVTSRIERVDALMSTWKPDSELSRFNRHASTEPFPASAETLSVFRVAREVSELSDGAFDVTVAPLVSAWGFGPGERAAAPPGDDVLTPLRRRVGFRRVEIEPAAGMLRKTAGDVECDLSAVAKGFAVDEVARALAALGQTRFLVEIGGELRAAGGHLDGAPWRVAIEAPDVSGRRIHRIVTLRDRAMATSGDYRNYYEIEGRRVSHTIDPRSGRPITHSLASVTVVAADAARADALATALHVLGPEAGYALAEAQGIAAYFIVRTPEAGHESRMTWVFEPLLAGPPD